LLSSRNDFIVDPDVTHKDRSALAVDLAAPAGESTDKYPIEISPK